jgi:hypothetical protein
VRLVGRSSSRTDPAPKLTDAPKAAHAPDLDLIAQRDRLVERYAVMQSELGGLFYEMAIRQHVRMEILMPRAAELQRVDTELGQLQRIIDSGASSIGGNCSTCGGSYAQGAVFCAQCGAAVTAE